MSYVPNTPANRAAMLAAIGVASVDDLFSDIPAKFRHFQLDVPPALSEQEVMREMSGLAARNVDLQSHPSFLGAGVYNHFIPAVVNSMIQRGEFLTAYTPYQPEVSQGTLQAIFEYQSLMCELTGMDVCNASMYDGSSALAEATVLASHATRRHKVVVAGNLHPEYREVIRTYFLGTGVELVTAPYDRASGILDLEALERSVGQDSACVVAQQPSFFGTLEDMQAIGEIAHRHDAMFVASFDPISLGLLAPPGEYDADIAVGEGQSMATGPSFGGPALGIFTCKEKYLRRMPGRVVGLTRDLDGRRGFVLTLAAREQHIRREKATSNICTNQTLIATAATIYLSLLGKQGLRRVAELCFERAHYAQAAITALPGYAAVHTAPFFQEFAVRCPAPAEEVNRRLLERGIIGGYALGRRFAGMDDCLLLCVTEQNPRPDIDRLVAALREVA